MRKALVVLGLALAGCSSPVPSEGPVFEGKQLTHWLREMEDLSRDRHQQAAKATVTFGAEAAPFLAVMLKDHRGHVREGAAYALARMGRAAEAAGPALVVAMEDGDPGVREDAWSAIWNLGEFGVFVPGAIEAKERAAAMETGPKMREAVRRDLEAYRKLMADQEKRKAHSGW